MTDQVQLSLLTIAVVCASGAAVRGYLAPMSETRSELVVYAVLSTFIALCAVLIVNAVGFDRNLWDDLLISTLFVLLVAPRHLVRR
jgi:hypothetical protein